MDRRNFIGSVGAAVAAVLAPGKALARLGFGRGVGYAGGFPGGVYTFDYYVSPTGDDNNPGTLASPWSITALNSKMSTYAGKRIGFLPGIYQYGTVGGVQTTLYALTSTMPNSGNGFAAPILSLQGGTSASAPTYLGSSDSNGNSNGSLTGARTAIIDCSDPSGGAAPTVNCSVIGQVYGYGGAGGGAGPPFPSQYGNFTIDGIAIRNWTYAAIVSHGDPTAGYVCPNIVIKNCELYKGVTTTSAAWNENPGAIFIYNAGADTSGNPVLSEGLQVTNCLIHDLSCLSPIVPSLGVEGIITFQSFGSVIKNCTFYNCESIATKDGLQIMDISYCYIGYGGTLGQGYYSGADSINPPGTVTNWQTRTGYISNFHHNIVIGPICAINESSGVSNQGQMNFYNNTFYKPGGIGGSNIGLEMFLDFGVGSPAPSGPYGNFDFYNNLVYAADAHYDDHGSNIAALQKYGASTGGTYSTLTCDYNAYGAGMTFGDDAGTVWDLAQWQALGQGYDTNSISLSSNPFSGTPTEPTYTTFAVSSSSPAYTAGQGGGICGAVDGSGPIGCNFPSAG